MTRVIDPLTATPETIREDARIREAEEAELRYARTGLTIDAQRAVDARRAVPLWRERLTARDESGRIRE